jgi:hypothetical protein
MQIDCLFSRVRDDINLYYEADFGLLRILDSIKVNHQSIAYCFRRLIPNDLFFTNNTNDPKYSFLQLRENNITSEPLYQWSAPIDLIEEYQFYLLTNQSSNMFFYNCTWPYFGSICQYKFLLNNPITFREIVQRVIMIKDNFNGFKILPCYVYINCICVSVLMCLDWRR